MLRATRSQFGFVPSPVAKAAASPELLGHLLAGFRAFDQTSLTPAEREVLALTVAHEHGCSYCMALHSALASQAPELSALVPALRAGAPLADARLEALRLFVRELVRERGQAGRQAWQRLEHAGFSSAQALELVLGVGVYVLSTFTNSVVDAALDPAFTAFAWQKPGARDPELD